MNKLKYKLTHKQAECLRDYILNNSKQIADSAGHLLANTVLLNYGISLSRKLLMQYPGSKTYSINYEIGIALFVIAGKKRLDQFSALELAVIVPIIDDVNRKILV